jgi:hypothetical protein
MRKLIPLLLLHFCTLNLCAQSSAEFLEIRARYGQINTVAGNGANDNCNDWQAFYEGGNATSADLSVPHMAVADLEGNIFIADKESHSIKKVSLDGKIHTMAGNGLRGTSGPSGTALALALREPNGIYMMPNGTFYFLETDDNCVTEVPIAGGTIRKVTPDGMMTTVITDAALFGGRALWVSPDESTIIYGSGTELRKWTAAGGITVFSSGYSFLGNIGEAPDGTFLVTDRSAHRVYRINADGSGKVSIAGTGGTTGGFSGQLATSVALFEVRGVAVLENGGYFVCTHKGGQVWYIDTNGYAWLFIHGDDKKSTHAGDGLPPSSTLKSISEPRAIALAPNGDILITENDKGFIRRVTNIAVEPKILRAERKPEVGFELEWTSHREGVYQLERSDDLTNWTALSVNASNGSTTVYADEDADSETHYFYRVSEP